jgi:hypothetical protein
VGGTRSCRESAEAGVTACTGPCRDASEQSTGRLEEKRKIGMNGRLQAVSTPRGCGNQPPAIFWRGLVTVRAKSVQAEGAQSQGVSCATKLGATPLKQGSRRLSVAQASEGPGRPGPAPGAASCPSRIGEGRGAPQGMHRQANAVVEGKTAPRLSVTLWGAKPRCPKPQARATRTS